MARHPPAPAARSYLWRLLLLIPAVALIAWGWQARSGVPADAGTVESVRLTTKPDIAGQVREAYDSVMPTTADLYLVVRPRGGGERRLPVHKDTPIGNGLSWRLDPPVALRDVAQIEVWDRRRLLGDKQLDRIGFDGPARTAKGQTFQLDLIGPTPGPPPWALPVLCAGATLAAVVVLRFVWDQAV